MALASSPPKQIAPLARSLGCSDQGKETIEDSDQFWPAGPHPRNRVYLGELKHKGASYPGEHAPIIPPAVFDAVQEKLTANRNGAKVRPAASAALLIGRVFDDHGHPMTPSTAKKGSIRYRNYISSMLVQGRRSKA